LAVVDCLHELLHKENRQIVNVASLDRHSLDESVERVERHTSARFSIEQRGKVQPNQAFSIRGKHPLRRRNAS
jgi:hypothetical protein